MSEVIRVLLEEATKVAEKIGAKALVIMEELPEEEIPDVGITVVIVGSTFDVEKIMSRGYQFPRTSTSTTFSTSFRLFCLSMESCQRATHLST